MRPRRIEGEALASYVHRFASLYELPWGEMATVVGLRRSGAPIPGGYGVQMTPPASRAFQYATGLDEASVAAMLLTRYEGTIDFRGFTLTGPGWKRAIVFGREWVYRSGSHFCPYCLTEDDGAWQLAWQLPWTFLCERHGVMLLDHCLECGLRSGGTSPRGGHPTFPGLIPEPGYCGNEIRMGAHRNERCGAHLATRRALVVAEDSELRCIQRGFTMAHDLDQVLAFDGITTSRQHFRDLRALCRAVRFTATVDELPAWLPPPARRAFADDLERHPYLESLKRREQSREAPDSVLLMAACLSIAEPVLTAPSLDIAADRLTPIVERVERMDRRKLWLIPQFGRFSDRLKLVWDKAKTPTLVKSSPASVRLRNGTQGVSFPPSAVPQMIWQPVFDAYFRNLAPPMRRDIYPRVVAIEVLRAGFECSLAEATDILGSDVSPKTVAAVWEAIRRTPAGERLFRRRVAACSTALSHDPDPVDYRARELSFTEPVDLPDFTAICRDAHVRPLRQVRLASCAWVLAQITGQSPRLVVGAGEVESLGRFERDLLPRLREPLTVSARGVLARCGEPDIARGLAVDHGRRVVLRMGRSA
jgi:TniQ